jgi:hypothetical protein
MTHRVEIETGPCFFKVYFRGDQAKSPMPPANSAEPIIGTESLAKYGRTRGSRLVLSNEELPL